MADGYDEEFSADWLYNTALEANPISHCQKPVSNCCASGQCARPQSQMQMELGSLVKMMREVLFNYHHFSCSVMLTLNGLQYS